MTDPLGAGVEVSTPILVLRRSFAPLQHAVLAVARSAGRLGIPVYAARMAVREPAVSSRYIRATFEVREDAADEQWLNALMRFDCGGERALLLPIDDVSAVFAEDHREMLESRYLTPQAPAGLRRRLGSKRALCEICEQIGLGAPASRFPSEESEALRCAGDFGYPVVLKRSEAWLEPRDPHAPSVAIVRDPDELLGCFRRMESDIQPQVMVQEYIPGGSEAIWMYNGCFGAGSESLCAFTGQKLRQRGPHTGPTTLGICTWNASVAQAAQHLAHELGYRGIVDMGFRYDARDGQYKLLDVNPRMGSTFRLFVAENGLDVVRALYLDLTGQLVPRGMARDGRRWIVEPYDLLAAAQIHQEGGLGLMDWLRSLRGIEEAAWWARDDRRPFFAMLASLGPLGLRYRARRVAGPFPPDPAARLASPVK